jgi:ribosome biogenesis GTPase
VVVLSKADLADDPGLCIRQAEGAAPLTEVLAVSAVTGEGVEDVRARLGPGRTGVFLGSSGVGKSTLVNRLLGRDALATQAVREFDSRGRHTTTRRQLIVLPDDGGAIIDTPGLRELALSGEGDGLMDTFAEVEEHAARCRFRDCSHQGEPDCAVREALLEGLIDPDRYESFLEQRRELAYQERRRDIRLRQAEEDRWKRITRDMRRRPQKRK